MQHTDTMYVTIVGGAWISTTIVVRPKDVISAIFENIPAFASEHSSSHLLCFLFKQKNNI